MKTKRILWTLLNLSFILLFHITVAQETGTKVPCETAEQYLLNQFVKKDVIFLGELHRTKEQVEFVSRIIPVLHKNGINLLFSEFANFKDTKRIDSLITAKKFDESLARRIQFENAWYWGYKEYVDIYYSAWKTNQTLLPNEKPFRIIGIEIEDGGIYDPEQVWAHIIDSISIEKGVKGLVYCGMAHSFTNYKQPYLVNDSLKGFVSTRVGNLLYKKYPDKIITVILHGPWYGNSYSSGVLPCNGMIDSLVNSLPEKMKEIGFSTDETFFSKYSLTNSLWNIGYGNLTLKDLCHGYIVIKPICDLNPVTVIPDFVNESNINEAIKQAEIGNLTAKEFNDIIKSRLEKNTIYLMELKKKFCN